MIAAETSFADELEFSVSYRKARRLVRDEAPAGCFEASSQRRFTRSARHTRGKSKANQPGGMHRRGTAFSTLR